MLTRFSTDNQRANANRRPEFVDKCWGGSISNGVRPSVKTVGTGSEQVAPRHHVDTEKLVTADRIPRGLGFSSVVLPYLPVAVVPFAIFYDRAEKQGSQVLYIIDRVIFSPMSGFSLATSRVWIVSIANGWMMYYSNRWRCKGAESSDDGSY